MQTLKILKSKIETFLDNYGKEADVLPEWVIDLLMDDHIFIDYNDKEYIIKKESVLYTPEDESILEILTLTSNIILDACTH